MRQHIKGKMFKNINYYDNIWQYSKYYADMIAMAVRLMENDESYASLLVLFNTTEMLFKSIREDDSKNFKDDIQWMHDKDYITDEEYEFLNSENGLRILRNKMTHKDFYQYFIEIDGILYPFTEKETWDTICELILPTTINIINNIILKYLVK